MASVTTNYGFDVPTSSDLVKNGATQIALLGQDLDTFLFRPFTRNGVINSGFQVWQRGTSRAVTSVNVYTADRWTANYTVLSPMTISRQATGDTTNLPFIQYCARVQRDSGGVGGTQGPCDPVPHDLAVDQDLLLDLGPCFAAVCSQRGAFLPEVQPHEHRVLGDLDPRVVLVPAECQQDGCRAASARLVDA